MDISQEMIIDLSLNVVGYLIAAALSIVIYSIFQRKREPSMTTHKSFDGVQTPSAQSSNETDKSDGVEFIKLGAGEPQTRNAKPTPESGSSTPTGDGKRDRAGVVRIALEMLGAGETTDRIKQALPISDIELALLQQSQSI